MAVRSAQHAPVIERRRPAPAGAARSTASSPPPVRALQERFGNQGAQAVIAAAQLSAAARLPTKVSKPTDPAEKEAEETARKVLRMPEPAASKAATKKDGTTGTVQREAASPVPTGRVASSAVNAGAGAPLPAGVRRQMEPRFGANFGNVRVHTNEAAAKQSTALGANAFTIGSDIFFGRNKFQPQSAAGQQLIAHELTHTVQQGAAPQRDEIRRSAAVHVKERVGPQVQRDWLDIPDPREYFAEKAENIPGFTMLTVVIGYNPITNRHVDRSAGNILEGAIQLMPGGKFVTDALESHGIFDSVSQWTSEQFDTLSDIGDTLYQDIENFLDQFSVTDLADPGALWDSVRAILQRPIDRVVEFAIALKDGIVQLIKDAILMPLAEYASTTRGFPLLCTVIGNNPITGDKVDQDPESLLGAFMKFIGEDELWATMQKAQAVPRAFAWFTGAIVTLKMFVAEIPGLFVTALQSLEVVDIILIPRAYLKLASVFGGFALRFVTWGAEAVWNLLEIIFDVVSPGALMYIKKTGAALKSILRDPLPFVGNLVKAAKLGFQNFADNFLGHLKAGLIDWLTGSLPGIYIPKGFTLPEIAKFALSVLGLTWANIREKLVKATSETVVKTLETGFDIVKKLVTEGPAAAWDLIKEQLANLKDMVIGGIIDFVVGLVVKRAIPKLVAMFIPGAGFISAILSIYDTIMVFVNKISQIVQVVTGFIDSLVAIASGAIGTAAARVERLLKNLLSLAISFAAGFLSLGNVANKIKDVIEKIRAPIDKALDWLVNWIVTAAKKLGSAVAQAGLPKDPVERFNQGMVAAEAAVNKYAGKPVGQVVLNPLLAAIKVRYGFKKLELFKAGTFWGIEGSMSPPRKVTTRAVVGEGGEVKLMKTVRTTSQLGGDTVGTSMTIDWLGGNYPAGTKPESGAQLKLMNLLVTDPGKSSEFKFIRGHLLNENLGGLGNDENMFPITGKANSQHLHSTEAKVKEWAKTPGQWVWYQVKVSNISSKLEAGPKSPKNFVQCTFVCQAKLKDAAGNVTKDFSTSIPSTYKVPDVATITDNITGEVTTTKTKAAR